MSGCGKEDCNKVTQSLNDFVAYERIRRIVFIGHVIINSTALKFEPDWQKMNSRKNKERLVY